MNPNRPMDINAQLRRIHAGDRQAFAPVVMHYQRALFGFLGRMGLGQHQAEDLAQETFVRAWQNLASYRPSAGAFSTWLFTIARHLALNELERIGRAQHTPLNDSLPDPPCPGPHPPDVLAQKQLRQRLQLALHRLSLPDRSVLALAYIQELDMAEIGKIEGCSTNAVKTRLHRARQRLATLLENNDV
jgi:RNA polymerase sigma-70 factor (ECF subfamily)